MPQTEVSDMAIAVPGLVADNSMSKDAVSCYSAEASAGIPFGVMVAQDSAADDAVSLPNAQNDLLKGVVMYHQAYCRPQELDDDGLQPATHMSVLRRGRVWVRVEDAVTPSSGVHVRRTAGVGEQLGAFRGTGDGTDTIEITDFAKFMTSADAGELAVLELDMTNASEATADS